MLFGSRYSRFFQLFSAFWLQALVVPLYTPKGWAGGRREVAMQNFASAPQAVGTRQKYRDPHESTLKGNIMHDKRVVRGNTYASVVDPKEEIDQAAINRQREAQRRRLQKANQTKKRSGTPEPVYGRKHMDIQTDSYLEELTERTVEFEAETQTDFILDRPPSPLFMPAKIGIDTFTQVEDGELFDFDIECEPILEVLVGKTLESGMMEVLEEAELESLLKHQEDFEKRRNSELLEVQRMEQAEQRRYDEMQRRLAQAKAQRERDVLIMRKVISRSIAATHLSSLKERALAHLLDAQVFKVASQKVVDHEFLPNLLAQVNEQSTARVAQLGIVKEMMHSSALSKRKTHQSKLDIERQRLRTIDDWTRKSREEKHKEQAIDEADRKRVEEEQACMDAWEQYQPPPPPPPEELIIVGVDADAQEVILEDESRLQVRDPEKLPELQELLGTDLSAEEFEGQKVLGDIFEQEDEEAEPTEDGEKVFTRLVQNFRIGVPRPKPAEEGAAEGAEGAAEGEAPAEG
eukprot:TRINITY_DN985_c0_g2_i1.p1 TRINITY_DN985_c0_g2~~TRINITY_DN985_c0_g2_i1.p1  ORF type:complete len:519 (-),score=189.53 TRINITY_DN985_c0_g2_i1:139-1695(-)